MATQRRPIQDRRAALRYYANLTCQFTFEENEYEAFIREISLIGAFLWSTFMPPRGADVSVKLETSLLRYPLILEGKIARRDCKYTEWGKVGAFAITFSHRPPGLISLINKLIILHE